MLTKQKLARFVKTRNNSGFSSNLQFQIDADACGFKVADLGHLQAFTLDGVKGYQWTTPFGRLIEYGRLYLEGQPEADATFSHMPRAEFVKAA